MTTNDRRERLAEIKRELGIYVGDRTHGLLCQLIDVVASLLPADEPAPSEPIELPASFVDTDGDAIEVRRMGERVRLGLRTSDGDSIGWVDIAADQVDAFVAAVLGAAGRP